jgi:hypothetical protein
MMDYLPMRTSARRAAQQHTQAAYEASLRQALHYAPTPTPAAGFQTPISDKMPFVPPPATYDAPPIPPQSDLRQTLVRAQQSVQAQLQALALHQRQLAQSLRDLEEGAVPRCAHACRVAERRGDQAVEEAHKVSRSAAEQATQHDAQQRHVRQSLSALRLAIDERPTQRQCMELASQNIALWVESDPGAEAWVRRAARGAVGAALGDGGCLSAELEDRVAQCARVSAARAAEQAARDVIGKGDFLKAAVEAVAQRAGGRVWGENHTAKLRDKCAAVAARAASDAVEKVMRDYGDRPNTEIAELIDEARGHAASGKDHRDQAALLLEGASASIAVLRKRLDDVEQRHATTQNGSTASIETTLNAVLVRLEGVERQPPKDPELLALGARLDALAKTSTTHASVEAVAANARDAVEAAEAKASAAQAEAGEARQAALVASSRADALEAKLEEVLAAVQQTGHRAAQAAQDIGKALTPVAESVAALSKRMEVVERRPRPAGAPPPRAPPPPIEHEEDQTSQISAVDDDSITPAAATTFGLPPQSTLGAPTGFGFPGSPGDQAATFGLPSMMPALKPLKADVMKQPDEDPAAQCQYCMKRVPRSRMTAHIAEACKMAFVPCPRGCGKRVLRFALAEHKASCAFGEAGFIPAHSLSRTPPARAVASSVTEQESPIGLRGLRALRHKDDGELAAALAWSPSKAEAYVAQTLDLPAVGALLARRHVNGATLAAMSLTDLIGPEPQGLGLTAMDADKLLDLIKRIRALPK